MKKLSFIYFIVVFIFTTNFLFAESHISTQSHQSQITSVRAVPYKSGGEFSYFTAGDDGFLIKWNENNEGEHYQISDVGIKMIVNIQRNPANSFRCGRQAFQRTPFTLQVVFLPV